MTQPATVHTMNHVTKRDHARELEFRDLSNRMMENERVMKELERIEALRFAMSELIRVEFCLLDNAPECSEMTDAIRPAMDELQKMLEGSVPRARKQGHSAGEQPNV